MALIRLPWWLFALLAVAAWFGLPHALPRAAAGFALADAAARAAPALAQAAAAAFGALAVLSLIRARWRRWRLRRRAARAASGKLTWAEFETLTSEIYRRQGYRIEESAGAGADGGIDLVLYRGAEKTLVQCKHWTTRRVGAPVVRELRGLVASEGADRGILVCSGRFTAAAEAYAASEPIELVDGSRLGDLIGSTR